VESLTSYIARLASSHHLPVWAIVVRELAPFFQRRSLIDGRGHCDLFAQTGASLNGLSQTASEAARLLSWRTQTPGLEKLTLIPLEGVISARSSIKIRAAWCPRCFDSWRLAGAVIYEPLVWLLKPLGVCPVHGTSLNTICPGCGEPHFPLERYSRPGFCPKCRAWLGANNDGSPASYSDLDTSAAGHLLHLIECTTSSDYRPSATKFRANLKTARSVLFTGSLSGFSKAAGVHHSSLQDLITGSALPGLDTLLRISHACQARPAEVLAEQIPPTQFRKSEQIPGRRPCRQYDWCNIRNLIRREMRKPVASRNSLTRLCKTQGWDSGYVAKILSDMAQTFVAEYRLGTVRRHHLRLHSEHYEVASTAGVMMGQGIWPSYRKLRRKFGRRISFLDPVLCRLRGNLMDSFRFIRV
jgi:TniQ